MKLWFGGWGQIVFRFVFGPTAFWFWDRGFRFYSFSAGPFGCLKDHVFYYHPLTFLRDYDNLNYATKLDLELSETSLWGGSEWSRKKEQGGGALKIWAVIS